MPLTSLQVTVDDIDLTSIGLTGDWPATPRWLSESLARSLASDPDGLVARCQQTHQLGLLESALRADQLWERVPVAARQRIRQQNAVVAILTRTLWRSADEINRVCRAAGIRPVFLKGICSSLMYYEQPYERPFKDIDMLVASEDTANIVALLSGLSYVALVYDRRAHALVEPTRGPANDGRYELAPLWKIVPVKLDQSLDADLAGYDGPLLRVSDDHAFVPVCVEVHFALNPDNQIPWARASWTSGPIGEADCLDAETQLLYTTYKAYIDLIIRRNAPSVKLACDAVRIASRNAGSIEWERLRRAAHDCGMCGPLRYMCFHASRHLGAAGDVESLGCCDCTGDDYGKLEVGDLLPHLLRYRTPFSLQPI